MLQILTFGDPWRQFAMYPEGWVLLAIVFLFWSIFILDLNEFVFLSTLLFYYFMLNCRAWVLSGEVSALILGSQSSCAYPRLSLLPNSLQNCLRRGWHSHYIFLLTLSDSLLAPSLQVNNYYVHIILYGVSLQTRCPSQGYMVIFSFLLVRLWLLPLILVFM